MCLAWSHLLVHMSSVLLYELCESDVVRSQFAEAIQDTCLTGVKEGDVLGHLHPEQRIRLCRTRPVDLMCTIHTL
jgi:hypothetical protein